MAALLHQAMPRDQPLYEMRNKGDEYMSKLEKVLLRIFLLGDSPETPETQVYSGHTLCLDALTLLTSSCTQGVSQLPRYY